MYNFRIRAANMSVTVFVKLMQQTHLHMQGKTLNQVCLYALSRLTAAYVCVSWQVWAF